MVTFSYKGGKIKEDLLLVMFIVLLIHFFIFVFFQTIFSQSMLSFTSVILDLHEVFNLRGCMSGG